MEDVRSKHYADTANWICKVIESCTTPKQEIACRNLIRLWMKQWISKLDFDSLYQLKGNMEIALDFKRYERIEKLKKNESTIS